MSDHGQFPDPHSAPGGVDSETDLETGADDSPDILQGAPEDEPDLSTLKLHETPFRTPQPGQHLTEGELEHDLDPDEA